MTHYFPDPVCPVGTVKVKLDLAKYSTKKDLSEATGLDASRVLKFVNLASIKKPYVLGKLKTYF